MNRSDQIEFVKELIQRVESQICDKIEHGKVPEDWICTHLRLYVVDKFVCQTPILLESRSFLKNYNNDILINDL